MLRMTHYINGGCIRKERVNGIMRMRMVIIASNSLWSPRRVENISVKRHGRMGHQLKSCDNSLS